MFYLFDKAVLVMAILRLISGTIEVTAGLLMLKLNQIDKALIINSSLALVGPVILIATTTIGLMGISDKISFTRIFFILIGIGFILYGVKNH
ncbi:YqhV family protein [Heyndrickxia acidicola]|uniref:YqhV family protein n=1 Tax=Heyndrickxia acidicola TaxID=209389 RepID=A0ABU6MH34_9BACI|nr:YqhV family protein [Heyndrickxia acidicola]MED1202963.1 YqhV family protein [Heyndrickxia acidicola]